MEDSEISCHFWHFWVTVPVVSTKAGYRRSTSAYKTFCRRLFSLRVGSRVPVLPYGPAHCRLLHNWQPFIEKVTETPAQHCNPMFVSLHILLREREHKKGISFNHGWISALRSVTFINRRISLTCLLSLLEVHITVYLTQLVVGGCPDF